MKRSKVPLKASGPTPASPRMLPDPPDFPTDAVGGPGTLVANDDIGSTEPTEFRRLVESHDSSGRLSNDNPLDTTHGHEANQTARKVSQAPLSDEDTFQPLRRVNTNTSTEYSFEEVNGLRRRRRNTFSDDEIRSIPRLVHRNLPFKQSRQEVAVVNKTIFQSVMLQRVLKTVSLDWFHIFLRQPTHLSMAALLFLWTFFIVMFACIYQQIDRLYPNHDCGLAPKDETIEFGPAFAFSLETCTTVGYGLPNSTNAFFEKECFSLQVAIYFQMVW